MAHPKRKHSKTRRDKRRSSLKLESPAISICPNCQQPKPPHYICPHCGKYKQTQYVEIKEKETKK